MDERIYGLLGRKLGHSWSVPIHAAVGNPVYRLIELEPEDLPAQWGFAWSTDPDKALPFIAVSTSPYMTGDCCTYEGHVWRSGQDGNVWEPGSVGVKWEDLGEVPNG